MLRVIFLRRIAAASVALASTAFLPGAADAAVYLNASNTATIAPALKIIANCTLATANLDCGQSQGVAAIAVNVNTIVGVTRTHPAPTATSRLSRTPFTFRPSQVFGLQLRYFSIVVLS